MTPIIQLLLAHFIGDFVLQPDSWVKAKEDKKWRAPQLYFHVLIHLVLSILFTRDLQLILPILVIIFLHYWIDLGKLYTQNSRNKRPIFILDQILHVVVILVVVYLARPFQLLWLTPETEYLFWTLLLCLVLVSTVSSRVIRILISRWTPETEDDEEDSLTNAGNYIGILERLFVFGFVITHHVASIGFLLAAKSIFRFGDLKESKDRKLTEYILIGTLLSFGMATLTGTLFLWLNSM